MTTFENAKVGDRVWDLFYNRWSIITNIINEDKYPIKTEIDSYTIKGTINIDGGRTLFWGEVVITPPEKPLPKLEVDTKVLVWDSLDRDILKRYFSHFDKDGTINVFSNGTTSWNYNITVTFNYWELAKDEQCQDS